MLDIRARALQWVADRSGKSFRSDRSVAEMRAGYADMNRLLGLRKRSDVETRDVSIPVNGGTIDARMYRPVRHNGTRMPALVYFHGGGFVIGDVASYDGLTSFLADAGQLTVISVDYRLAPEYRFPTAFDDSFAAFAYIAQQAQPLGIDPQRIAVGGDSAGGCIAAVLSAYHEERSLPKPAYQLLIYPSVDATGRFPSRHAYPRGVPLTSPAVEWFAKHFLAAPNDAAAPYMTSLDAPNPERLPPTYLLAARHDPLFDEGRAYAQRVQSAGVSIVYDLRESLPHAFVNMAGAVPAARRALEDAIRATAASLREQR